MQEIKKYRVVFEIDFIEFDARINELLQKGWEPLGGVSVSDGFYQAMVKS